MPPGDDPLPQPPAQAEEGTQAPELHPEQEQEHQYGQGSDDADIQKKKHRRFREQIGEQEDSQLAHKAENQHSGEYPERPGYPIQGVAVYHRVGVELRGLRVVIAVEVEPPPHLTDELPPQTPAVVLTLPAPEAAPGLQPVAHRGGLPSLKGGKQEGGQVVEVQAPPGHILRPALEAVDVHEIHRDQLVDSIPHGSSSCSACAASARQLRRRAISS